MKDNFARSESHVEQGLIVPESLTEVLRGFLYLLLGAQAAAGEVSLVCHSVLSLLDGDSPSLPLVHVAGNRFPVAGPEPSKMPEVPGEREAKVELRPSRSLWYVKAMCVSASVLNEQRVCPFFIEMVFHENCAMREISLYVKDQKKVELKV